MNERIEHIDILKGVAVFLMVAGHFLSNCIDHLCAKGMDNDTIWFVGSVIYTFHMPLFFFSSGYLYCVKDDRNLPDGYFRRTLIKRAIALMLPWVSFAFIGFLMNGHPSFNWFLPALFWASIAFTAVHCISSKKKLNFWKEFLFHIMAFVVLFVATHFITKTWFNDTFVCHKAMKFYPYLVMGWAFRKYEIRYGKTHYSKLLTLGVLGYLMFWYLTRNIVSDPHEFLAYPLALCAILVCYVCITSTHTHNCPYISAMGRQSLAIYMMGGWFLIWFPQVGDLLLKTSQGAGGWTASVMLQLLLPLVPCFIACGLSMLLQNILSLSKWFNLFLFGKKWW